MKQTIKNLFGIISFAIVLPLIVITRGGMVFRSYNAFSFLSKLLSLLPGITGVYIRRAYYGHTIPECGKNLTIEFGSFFSKPNVIIGDNVYIGAYCIIGNAEIGNNTLIASRVSILSGSKQHMDLTKTATAIRKEPIYEKISIGDNCWIGEGAILMNNIGNDSIIGAGSVVVKEFGNSITAAGNPAKTIIKRS